MRPPSLTSLKRIYDDCARYAAAQERSPERPDVSAFWREELTGAKRRSWPSFDEVLVMRRGFTYPLGDRSNVQDRDAERQYAEAAWRIVGPDVPGEWWETVSESALGAPIGFDFGRGTWSGGGLVNALTASRVHHWCERSGIAARPLRVLEIGAGYGQLANQLLQRLETRAYADCDLVENLFLCAFYLRANMPERHAAFVEGGAPPADAELVFLVPGEIEELAGPFDLVVNSYSFQEMELASVERYFEFVSSTLAPDGLFYSLNAHAKAGVRWPSEYPVERFELVSMLPVRRFPWQVFGSNPYELVLRPRAAGAAGPDEVDRLRTGLDGLGCALQLGFHDELVPLCEEFAAGSDDGGALAALAAYARDPAPASKLTAADRLGELGLGGVAAHLRGLVELAFGSRQAAAHTLAQAVRELGQSHARVRSHIALAGLARERGDIEAAAAEESAATALAPHLEDEIRRWSGGLESYARMLASQLAPGHEPPVSRRRGRVARVRERLRALRNYDTSQELDRT